MVELVDAVAIAKTDGCVKSVRPSASRGICNLAKPTACRHISPPFRVFAPRFTHALAEPVSLLDLASNAAISTRRGGANAMSCFSLKPTHKTRTRPGPPPRLKKHPARNQRAIRVAGQITMHRPPSTRSTVISLSPAPIPEITFCNSIRYLRYALTYAVIM